MKRPEVTLENYQAVFDYYDQRGPNTNFAHFGHFVMGRKFHPAVSFAPGAEQTIGETLAEGAQVILVTNHDSEADQFNLASFVSKRSVFGRLVSKTVIMARYGLFNEPGRKGKLQRIAIDELGSFPAFRAKDGSGDANSPERQLQKKASASTRQLGFNKTARDRYHLAGFPEGQRTPAGEDHTVVRTLSPGFGEIYANLADRKIMVVSAGIAYGIDERDYTNPTVYIGDPITTRIPDATEFTGQLRTNMQRDLTMAYDLRTQRPVASQG